MLNERDGGPRLPSLQFDGSKLNQAMFLSLRCCGARQMMISVVDERLESSWRENDRGIGKSITARFCSVLQCTLSPRGPDLEP